MSKWLDRLRDNKSLECASQVSAESDKSPQNLESIKTYTLDNILIDSTDPNAALAIKYEVQGLGEFWIVCDEDMRRELLSEGLPCILPEDLVYIMQGTSHSDRLRRLKDRVAVGSVMAQTILDEFPGSQIMKVTA